MKKIVSLLLAVFVLPTLFTGAAYANHCNTAQSVFGSSYTLANGQTLNSNLVIFGGDATIEEGATVNCTIVVFGGNVDIAGEVDEDVVVMGGNVDLASTAVVNGQIATMGGSTSRAEGAVVQGGETQSFRDFPLPLRPVIFDSGGIFNPLWQFASTIFNSVALGLLALLVVLFWPDHTARVSAAITTAPGASGGFGLLTFIAVPILLVVTAITLCLIPVTLVGALLYAMALVFGWLALGMAVGARLSVALNLTTLSPAVSAALGTTLITLVSGIVQIIPCVGWLLPFALTCLGLGAVMLTRFGTRPYLGSMATPPPPAPVSDAPLAS